MRTAIDKSPQPWWREGDTWAKRRDRYFALLKGVHTKKVEKKVITYQFKGWEVDAFHDEACNVGMALVAGRKWDLVDLLGKLRMKDSMEDATLLELPPPIKRVVVLGACGCGSSKYPANHPPSAHRGWAPE